MKERKRIIVLKRETPPFLLLYCVEKTIRVLNAEEETALPASSKEGYREIERKKERERAIQK